MNKIKAVMAKNRFVSYVVIFPFTFMLTISAFSFLLNFILPVLISVFLTKYFFRFLLETTN